MKNRKVFFILAVVAVIAAVIAVFAVSQRKSSFFIIENNENGSISVTAQKAADKSTGMGYITISEGSKLRVRCSLTDKSSILLEVFPGETDAATGVLMEEKFTAIDTRLFELPEGEYSIRITAGKGTEGTMDISAEKE